ncbi:uncharacterized protein LOC114240048 [Bombyx mandarina]|uniref:Uncharacterized protein LOC114240048 n=1 Tax=Bombyx mandarina TaxID=7092 RepID=A0A6J2J9Z0_BOMMA|nr:uncharacterized protein LOC114240048 [Bombyx mandarina]
MSLRYTRNYYDDRFRRRNVHGESSEGGFAIQNRTSQIEETEIRNDGAQETSESNVAGSSSSHILDNDVSALGRDVDRWVRPQESSTTQSTGVQDSMMDLTHRSTVRSRCTGVNSMWYIVALVMPLFSVHNCVMTLRCTPSTVMNTAEIILHHVNKLCTKARANLRRLVQDQIARDFFATAMDIVLVIYALGFLILSLYQASVFG